MDNIRFGLLCAAAVICFFLYQAWQQDYPVSKQQQAHVEQQSSRGSSASSQSAGSDVPEIDHAESKAGTNGNTDSSPLKLESGQKIHVVTDKFDAIIDTHGGGLREVRLRGVPVSDKQPDVDLRLINDSLPNFFIEQSGLIAPSSEPKAPSHNAVYKSAKTDYKMAEGADELKVPLQWSDGAGHTVTKYYVFHRDSYKIGLHYKVENKTADTWNLAQYVRYWRTPSTVTEKIPFSRPFFGVGWYQDKGKDDYSYQKRSHDDLGKDPLNLSQVGGWVAMVQHYFVGAVIPPADSDVRFFARSKPIQGDAEGYAAGFKSQKLKEIAPGQTQDIKSALYIGPKHQSQLDAAAPGLGLTIDYGWFAVLARPIFAVLKFLHGYVGNWGVSIILLTVLIKLLFYKLSEIQFRGMARMRKFQPRMKRLKEQYGDDRGELQKRMMELYKKEGFNPMAGCWPLLVQMPVFISLYWVLRESAELRQAPFIFWIQNLSAPDPYYILPVAFGVIMFLQQKLNVTAVMDPMQQRIMQIMPIGMAVFFAFFPAGLVLYWCTNSLLTIAQQWYIYRKLDAEGLGRHNHKGS